MKRTHGSLGKEIPENVTGCFRAKSLPERASGSTREQFNDRGGYGVDIICPLFGGGGH